MQPYFDPTRKLKKNEDDLKKDENNLKKIKNDCDFNIFN